MLQIRTHPLLWAFTLCLISICLVGCEEAPTIAAPVCDPETSCPMDALCAADGTACVPVDTRPGPGEPGPCGWTSTHFDPCTMPAPGPALELLDPGVYEFDTGDQILLSPDGTAIPVPAVINYRNDEYASAMMVDGFTLGPDTTLTASGPRAVMVISHAHIDIEGVIDVTGLPGLQLSAGARRSCPDGAFSSGGGGGFGRPGAPGGGATEGSKNGWGGASSSIPSIMVGGCAGAFGEYGALGGSGGGAILLAARGTVRVNGTIVAGGAGGQGGPLPLEGTVAIGDDGGGGGSGGLIKLEAASILLTSSARLSANGGAGGGGSTGGDMPVAGQDGENGQAAATVALGGVGAEFSGGDGGDGGAVGVSARPGAESSTGDGHGGGGGGVGFILIRSDELVNEGAAISPLPVLL